ncbi:MAG: helix-turn-helix transcriptional regulator [Candidatus Omnitrophica bacterium]|nr:helix-turn-helix transcriptional regulator [Candidatus Omnitrophota bacterium]
MGTERVEDHLKKELKDPYFRELYELEEQKLAIVKKIIEYRIKHKFSQNQLAKRAGVTQQHISKVESGEFSSVTTLEKILLHIGYTMKIKATLLPRKVAQEIEVSFKG